MGSWIGSEASAGGPAGIGTRWSEWRYHFLALSIYISVYENDLTVKLWRTSLRENISRASGKLLCGTAPFYIEADVCRLDLTFVA